MIQKKRAVIRMTALTQLLAYSYFFALAVRAEPVDRLQPAQRERVAITPRTAASRLDTLENKREKRIYRLDLLSFRLVVGEENRDHRTTLSSVEMAAGDWEPIGHRKWEAFPDRWVDASHGWRVPFRSKGFDVSVSIMVDDKKGRIYKWLEVRSRSENPQVIWDCRLLHSPIEVSADQSWQPARVTQVFSKPGNSVAFWGGYGIPVYVGGLFYGIEFPLHRSRVDEGGLHRAEYYPATVLPAGGSLSTERLVIGLAEAPSTPKTPIRSTARGSLVAPIHERREAVQRAFRRYLGELAWLDPSSPFYYYNSWGTHEYEGPSAAGLTPALDRMETLQQSGIQWEYFMIDAGYSKREGLGQILSASYAEIDPERFPGDSFAATNRRIQKLGMKSGVWTNPGCLASESLKRLEKDLIELYDRYGVSWIMTDFVATGCRVTDHGHPPGKYADYQGAKNLIGLIQRMRQHAPGYAFYLTTLGQSPWWMAYADFVVHGREDHCDIPAPSSRKSHILANDSMHYFWCLDAGVLLNYSDADFYQGTLHYLDGLLMSVARQGRTIYLGGDLSLLTKDDERELAGLFQRHRSDPDEFATSSSIVSYSGPDRIYGYVTGSSAEPRERQAANLFLFNSGWHDDTVRVPLSLLAASPTVRTEQIYSSEGRGRYERGHDSLQIYLPPWSVIWIRVEGSDRDSSVGSGPIPELRDTPTWHLQPTARVELPEGTEDSLQVPLEMAYYLGGGTWHKAVTLPAEWKGFPLKFHNPAGAGELYLGTVPLRNRQSDPMTLVWPGTLPYRQIRFGGRSEVFYGYWGLPSVERAELRVQPIPYYRFTLDKHTVKSNSDLWATVVVRFMSNGQPTTEKPPLYDRAPDEREDWGNWPNLGNEVPLYGEVCFLSNRRRLPDAEGFPPQVPQIWSGYSWSVQRHRLSGLKGDLQILIPRLADTVDYDIRVMLTR